MKSVFTILSLGIILSGCATNAPATDEPREEVVYSTGSNLPKKYRDPAQTSVDKDRAIERGQYESTESLRSRTNVPK
jgi:PBP1b-binding outer membrane lipoprotein LpoB